MFAEDENAGKVRMMNRLFELMSEMSPDKSPAILMRLFLLRFSMESIREK